MSRKQKSDLPFSCPTGFKPQSQAPLPLDLRALGWRRTGRGCAERCDAAGLSTAFVDVDIVFNAAGKSVTVWRGYSKIPQRETLGHFLTAADAIRAVVHAEAAGPLGAFWKGQDGPPQRDGWKHQVRQKRDTWYRLAIEGAPLIVIQAPVEPSLWPQSLRYVASIDGQLLTHPDGSTCLYDSPISALESAERNAIRGGYAFAPASVHHNIALS